MSIHTIRIYPRAYHYLRGDGYLVWDHAGNCYNPGLGHNTCSTCFLSNGDCYKEIPNIISSIPVPKPDTYTEVTSATHPEIFI